MKLIPDRLIRRGNSTAERIYKLIIGSLALSIGTYFLLLVFFIVFFEDNPFINFLINNKDWFIGLTSIVLSPFIYKNLTWPSAPTNLGSKQAGIMEINHIVDAMVEQLQLFIEE